MYVRLTVRYPDGHTNYPTYPLYKDYGRKDCLRMLDGKSEYGGQVLCVEEIKPSSREEIIKYIASLDQNI